ncbi:hypothetical protein BD769DRAFT_1677392 [Suillus cothurnatus]|nr:hypothetical protein BD769DRAFT_1677392 [Suillus cothurnatus]
MALSLNHDHHAGNPALFDSFIFESIGLMPLSGDFVDVGDVDFMAYLALGLGPTLYPLYCPMALHDELRAQISLYAYVLTPTVHLSALETQQSKEVPVYVSSLHSQIEQLDFRPKSTRMGPDHRFYVVYDFVGSENSTTVVHLARHPAGYHPWTDIDFTAFAAMSDNVGRLIVPNECITSDTVMSGDVVQAYGFNDAIMADPHHGDQCMISEDLTNDNASEVVMSNPPTVYSWISYSANMTDNAAISVYQSPADRRRTRIISKRQQAKKSAQSEGGLKRVMRDYPRWKIALAYLRSLLRVAVCFGTVGNPHLLNFERKADAIRDTWPQALLQANIGVEELEEVASLISSTPMSNENVLRLANPSLSEFIYDVKRLALCSIGHPQAGFDFDDVATKVKYISDQSVCPVLPPIAILISTRRITGFAWFLGHQMAKEVMWHIVFRPSSTCGVRLVLADLEPAAFRNADHPPFSTMALLGSVCYSAVLDKYSALTNIPVDLLTQYPTPAQVYNQLCETAVELVEIHDDQDHPKLMTDLSNLCKIVITDVHRPGRNKNNSSQD